MKFCIKDFFCKFGQYAGKYPFAMIKASIAIGGFKKHSLEHVNKFVVISGISYTHQRNSQNQILFSVRHLKDVFSF